MHTLSIEKFSLNVHNLYDPFYWKQYSIFHPFLMLLTLSIYIVLYKKCVPLKISLRDVKKSAVNFESATI